MSLARGLESGRSAPLEISPIEGKGLGVVALEAMSEGDYVTEYKYSKVYDYRKKNNYEKKHVKNDEGWML